MYCVNCGKQVSDLARFCPFCGQELRRPFSPGPAPDMRCPQCGGLIGQGCNPCPYCGHRFGKAGTNSAGPASHAGEKTGANAAGPTTPAGADKGAGGGSGRAGGSGGAGRRGPSRRRVGTIVAVAVVALVVVGLVCALVTGLLGSDGGDGGADASEEPTEAFYEAVDESRIVENDGLSYVDGQVLVTAANGASYADVTALLVEAGGEVVGYLPVTGDYQVNVEGDYDYEGLVALCAELEESDLVATATPSYAAEGSDDSVDYTADPWTSTEDASDVSGTVWDADDPDGLNWWAEAIGMTYVWDIDLSLATVRVGVLDSSFDLTNEDLDEAFVAVWNNPETVTGSHGTHVAGIIAAEAEDGFGIAGVAQNAELYGYACEGDNGSDTWASVFQWKYALALLLGEGTSVINVSRGFRNVTEGAAAGDAGCLEWLDVASGLLSDFLATYIDAGYEFLIVKSAGNAGVDASYDILGHISDEEVAERIIIVGNAENDTSGYSPNATSNFGDRVDVWAPGTWILSDLTGNATGCKTGTSMATPMVTGVCALVWGANPDLTAAQVRQIVLASVQTRGSAWYEILLGLIIDDETDDGDEEGVAIVNAYAALVMAKVATGLADEDEAETLGCVIGTIYACDESGAATDAEVDAEVVVYTEDGTEVAAAEVSAMIGALDNLQTYSVLLSAGTYVIEVSAEGYVSAAQTVTVEAGDALVVDLGLVPGEDETTVEVIGTEVEHYGSGTTGDLTLYASVLDELYWGLSDQWYGWDLDALQVEGIIGYFWYWNLYFEDQDTYWGYPIATLDNACYAFVDIDGDGTSELLTGVITAANSDAVTLYDVYTIVDGEVVLLADTGTRWSYWVCDDGTIGCYTSYSALEGAYDYLVLVDGALQVTDSLAFVLDDDGNATWYYSEGSYAGTESPTISADEAEAIIDGHTVADVGYVMLKNYEAD